MRTAITTLAASFLLAIPAAALAQPGQPPPPPPPGPYAPAPPPPPMHGGGYYYAAPPPGAHTHDGFYMRLAIGPAFTHVSAEEGGEEVVVSGGGAGLVVSLGGNISRNLILYGEIVADVASNPDVEVNGDSFETEDVSAGIAGIGVGLAYYTDSNIYFSGTLAATQFTVDNQNDIDDDDFRTELGPGFSAMIGKEWWVSDNWGLGIAGQLFFASMKDEDFEEVTWNATGLGVLFSATYD